MGFLDKVQNAIDDAQAGYDSRKLRSRNVIKVVDIISEGVIEGVVNEESGSTDIEDAIFYDDTAISTLNSNENKIQLWQSKGTSAGLPLEIFSAAENTITTGVDDIAYNSTWATEVPAAVDAVKLIITFPQGLYQQGSDGSIRAQYQSIQFSRRILGGTNEIVQFPDSSGTPQNAYNIVANTRPSFQRSVYIRRPPNSTGIWVVNAKRLIENTDTDANFIDFTVSHVIEIDTYKGGYKDMAFIGQVIPSDQIGSTALSSRSFQVKGIKIQVPTNYNPVTDTYSGAWNGAFKTAWSNSPPWIIYDLLTNTRYGMGRQIDASRVDKYSFYDAATYCSQEVDGKPRFTFNGTLSTRSKALDVIQQVAAVARCQITEIDGVIKLIQDKPTNAKTTLTNSDVINGEFSYSGANIANITTECTVTYNEPSKSYAAETVTFTDEAAISRFRLNTQDVVLIGCTSKEQALRHARWIVETEVNQSRLITFAMSWKSYSLTVGDVIVINDNHSARATESFKILSITDNGDGSFAFSGVVYDQTKFDRIDNNTTSVYSPEFITNTSAGSVSSGAGGTGTAISPVRNLLISPMFVTSNDSSLTTQPNLLVEWDAPLTGTVAKYVAVWYHADPAVGGGFADLSAATGWNGTEQTFTIPNAADGKYTVRVYAYANYGGVRSDMLEANYILSTGGADTGISGTSNLDPPLTLRAVPYLANSKFTTRDLTVNWTPNPANEGVGKNLVGYKIAYYNEDGTIELASRRVPKTTTQDTLYFDENAAAMSPSNAERTVRVLIWAVDSLGRLSVSRYNYLTNDQPAAVTGFGISIYKESGYFSFNEVNEADIAGYKIIRSEASTMVNSVVVYDGKENSGTIAAMDEGKTYYFRVGAYDTFSSTDINYSTTISRTTLESDKLTKWEFNGFRAFLDGTNLKIVGDTLTKDNGTGNATQIAWKNVSGVTSSTATYIRYGATGLSGRWYYIYNGDNGTNGQVISSQNYTDVISSNNRRLLCIVENGAILQGENGVGTPIIDGDQILAGLIGANHLVTGSAVITGTAQIGTANVETLNIRGNAVSTVEAFELNQTAVLQWNPAKGDYNSYDGEWKYSDSETTNTLHTMVATTNYSSNRSDFRTQTVDVADSFTGSIPVIFNINFEMGMRSNTTNNTWQIEFRPIFKTRVNGGSWTWHQLSRNMIGAYQGAYRYHSYTISDTVRIVAAAGAEVEFGMLDWTNMASIIGGESGGSSLSGSVVYSDVMKWVYIRDVDVVVTQLLR